MDHYDKLTCETSLKPAFAGLEAKEVKKLFPVSVAEVSSRRVVIAPSNPHAASKLPDPCVPAPAATVLIPAAPAGMRVVFISIKVAPGKPNGYQPILLRKSAFTPQHDAGARDLIKLDADAVTYFTTGNGNVDAAFDLGVPAKLWEFNPNRDPIAVDVKAGFGPPPPAAAAAVAGPAVVVAAGHRPHGEPDAR
jgi:hypothetical protein